MVYKIPWFFSEISGWHLEKTYFDWMRLVVREFESGPVVVELNQTLFNSPFLPNLIDLAEWGYLAADL